MKALVLTAGLLLATQVQAKSVTCTVYEASGSQSKSVQTKMSDSGSGESSDRFEVETKEYKLSAQYVDGIVGKRISDKITGVYLEVSNNTIKSDGSLMTDLEQQNSLSNSGNILFRDNSVFPGPFGLGNSVAAICIVTK